MVHPATHGSNRCLVELPGGLELRQAKLLDEAVSLRLGCGSHHGSPCSAWISLVTGKKRSGKVADLVGFLVSL